MHRFIIYRALDAARQLHLYPLASRRVEDSVAVRVVVIRNAQNVLEDFCGDEGVHFPTVE